jgi:penicillin-binding protein 1A
MRRYLSSPLRLSLAALLGVGGAALLGLAGSYQYLRPSLPDVTAIKDIRLQVPLRVFSRDGRLIAQFGEQRRIPLCSKPSPAR